MISKRNHKSSRAILLASCIVLLGPCFAAFAGQNVVVVLDDSGSMDERMRRQRRVRKIDAAKEALVTVLESLPPDAKVGVALLNGRVNGQAWLIPLGPVDIDRTHKAVASVRAKGGTPLGRFMKVGADALLEVRDQDHYGSYRLLIVTDGEAGDERLVERYLPDIMARGVTVDVIGVDMKSKHSLATKVHSYRRADDPQSLTQAIQEVFAETGAGSSAAGENDFELLEGVPTEIATAALAALAESGNHPIGERAPSDAGDAAEGGQPGFDGPGSSAPGSGGQGGQRRRNSGSFLIAIVVFVVLFNILRAVYKSIRRR